MIQEIITFYHEEKTAKKKLIDEKWNIIVFKGKIQENLNYDYSMFHSHKEMFELLQDNGIIGDYILKNN